MLNVWLHLSGLSNKTLHNFTYRIVSVEYNIDFRLKLYRFEKKYYYYTLRARVSIFMIQYYILYTIHIDSLTVFPEQTVCIITFDII